MDFKRIISILLVLAVFISMSVTGYCKTEISQPFESGTAGSERYRIPAIYTLKSGRLVAVADARYGHGTDSPANIDTAFRYSDDNGKTWSEPQLINHFIDVEDGNYDNRAEISASFIDSAVCEDSNGKIYVITDAWAAYTGYPTSSKSSTGIIDGRLVLCDRTTTETYESMKLNKENYPYYIGDFKNDFAPVLKFSDNGSYNNYCVDREFNLYKNENGSYKPVFVNQIAADTTLTGKNVQANVFFAYSPIKIYPACYMWLRTSTDGGETWSDPEILNAQVGVDNFTGVGPGRGFVMNYNGKERVIFPVYDNNKAVEHTSVVYTDDGGKTWHRGARVDRLGISGKGSEAQIVQMNNGVIRMFMRNTAKYISYADSTDGGETWSRAKLDRGLKYCSNCMVSFINYSAEIDGKQAIIAAYPTEKTRKLGVVKIGLYGDNNRIDWKYCKKITEDTNDITYIYSCLSELKNGEAALLYEYAAADMALDVFTVDELKQHDEKLTFWQKIVNFFINLFN